MRAHYIWIAMMAGISCSFAAPAPNFSATGADGKLHSLAANRGKIIVLEWVNHDGPFVKKHYDSGSMQQLQKAYTAKGVVWFSVFSSAPGRGGHVTAAQALALTREKNAAPTALLMDPTGALGKQFSAERTPQLFIIDKAGQLVYQGAIDNKPTFDPRSIAGATNYVKQALDALLAGKPVPRAKTRAYGSSVKYGK